MKKIKLIIAEDHPLMRTGYVSAFEDYDNISVIGEAENGKVLLELLERKKPDIVLLDIEMPEMNGAQALQAIKAKYPHIKIIMATLHNEQEYIIDFYKKGVNGYYIKGCHPEILVEAINTVYKEGYHITKACSEAILKETVKDDIAESEKNVDFNIRQLQIIILIAAGKSNKEIADQLHVTLKTIDYHKHNIYAKTKTTNSAGLTDYAHRNGIMKPKN